MPSRLCRSWPGASGPPAARENEVSSSSAAGHAGPSPPTHQPAPQDAPTPAFPRPGSPRRGPRRDPGGIAVRDSPGGGVARRGHVELLRPGRRPDERRPLLRPRGQRPSLLELWLLLRGQPRLGPAAALQLDEPRRPTSGWRHGRTNAGEAEPTSRRGSAQARVPTLASRLVLAAPATQVETCLSMRVGAAPNVSRGPRLHVARSSSASSRRRRSRGIYPVYLVLPRFR